MTVDDAFMMQKSKPATDRGKTTRGRNGREPERVQGGEKGADRFVRHLSKIADLALAEIPLKFFQVPPIGIDGIARKAAFDADMVEIARDQRVDIHCGDDSQSFH